MKEKVKKPFYKKWWFWVLAVIVVIAISGGGNESDSKDTSSKITDEKKTETTATTPAKKEEPKKEEKAPVVVFDNEQVTISFKSADSRGVKFLVENKTDKSLTVQAESVAVNGFSANDIMMSDAVAPKSKGYVTAKTSELSEAGTPETVSGSLRVIDFGSSNMETIEATFTNVSVK